ncbi:hypothetical protein NECID01_1349 [Nematocida sp. AWRm77]|nr:hypothetical protein NECID01_1349 [Nematocida sp. AWRm77]
MKSERGAAKKEHEEKETVERFCDLLSTEERKEFFSLLVEYGNRIERLALLFIRAQEYRLALKLSRNSLQEHLKGVQSAWKVSLLAGIVCGLGCVAIFSWS